jgi:hypothetical protein
MYSYLLFTNVHTFAEVDIQNTKNGGIAPTVGKFSGGSEF